MRKRPTGQQGSLLHPASYIRAMALFREPSITLEGVTVRSVAADALELEVDIRVENPNLVGVTIRDLPFSVFCRTREESVRLATGNAGQVKIRGKGSTTLAVPVSAHSAGILGAMAAFIASGGVDLEVRGTASIDCIVACPAVPFSKTIRLSAADLAKAFAGKSGGGNKKDGAR